MANILQHLIWVYTVCNGLSVLIHVLRVIMVIYQGIPSRLENMVPRTHIKLRGLLFVKLLMFVQIVVPIILVI